MAKMKESDKGENEKGRLVPVFRKGKRFVQLN